LALALDHPDLGRGRKRDRRDVGLMIEEKSDRPIQLIHCGVDFR
jgi:hypothetical protein